jgi:hypothetical protein
MNPYSRPSTSGRCPTRKSVCPIGSSPRPTNNSLCPTFTCSFSTKQLVRHSGFGSRAKSKRLRLRTIGVCPKTFRWYLVGKCFGSRTFGATGQLFLNYPTYQEHRLTSISRQIGEWVRTKQSFTHGMWTTGDTENKMFKAQ